MANEAQLHQMVVDWLQFQHPSTLFRTDYAAGARLNLGQAIKHKRLQKCRAWPDILIAEPRGGKHGLFVELKDDAAVLYLKDGTMTRNLHIREQEEVLQMLRDRGYAALFSKGFEQTQTIITEYLSHV